MKTLIIVTIYISFLSCVSEGNAQIIRKNYTEMGPDEITDYNEALQLFYNGGSLSAYSSGTSASFSATAAAYISDYPIVHYEDGSWADYIPPSCSMLSMTPWSTTILTKPMLPDHIHMSVYFLPFHRTFLLDWEQRLRAMGTLTSGRSASYLSAPFWDWRKDADATVSTNTTSTSYPSLWAYSFIPASNFSSWGFSYYSGYDDYVDICMGGSGVSSSPVPPTSPTAFIFRPTTFNSRQALDGMAGPTVVNSVMGHSSFYDMTRAGLLGGSGFSNQLEDNPHNSVHGWVAGAGTTGSSPGLMGAFYSPFDPVFWMHHGMVDKLWTEWEEGFTSAYGSTDLLSLPTSISWRGVSTTLPATLPIYTTEACSTKVECRNLSFNGSTYEVWYADNGKVLINGNKHTDFVVTRGTTRTYRYVVWNSSSIPPSYSLGEMYIGDIKCNASSLFAVASDFKGGVEVPDNSTAHFRTAGAVIFMPGSKVDRPRSGSYTDAKIINTPDGL